MAKGKRAPKNPRQAESYRHPEAENVLRPDVGTQAQFRKKKPPATYRYDSSLSPELDYDGQNPAREQGEALIREILEAKSLEEAKEAAGRLKALSRPFLNWAGKAERLSFDVPTLPLFVHERLSTKAIIETLTGHKRDKQLNWLDLFADPQYSVADQVLKAYEYPDKWVNRMILGDSLVVMNSLLHYENLGGQVQMIYMDPPYGVKFGSNFQPFVRKRDVKPNDDEDMTREPEMVQAYRDTWELGLHSYLTYMRDRLVLCRELLHPRGSVFVQISDENLHHVRELLDEVFGSENCCAIVSFVKTAAQSSELLSGVCDYLLWYARDIMQVKYRQLYRDKTDLATLREAYSWLLLSDGSARKATQGELDGSEAIPQGAKLFRLSPLTSQRPPGSFPFTFKGDTYLPGKQYWKTHEEGLKRCEAKNRLQPSGRTLFYRMFLEDFACVAFNNVWTDTQASFADKIYVVQTGVKVVQRCLLMTTDPGDLVLDPTCGSGTTAYVTEQWGRRWITIDVSRVPQALARQRLLTATFPWYELKDEERGPAGGFVYKRKQNNKGEEVGGIVPHVTLKSIANNEPPAEEVLVDRPEVTGGITRVTGPFAFEATIPAPADWEGDGDTGSPPPQPSPRTGRETGSYVERMVEVLRKSPVLRLEGNKTVTLKNVRPPAKSLSLSAEALVAPSPPTPLPQGERGEKAVAFVFGPENGAVSERLVYEAAREANAKSYAHLYVIGFAIQPNARGLVEHCAEVVGIPATYVQATPDLLMGDLLKNMRSSQIFSVCGLPEVRIHHKATKDTKNGKKYQVELVGMDVFDPVTMEVDHRSGTDVPAWFLDSDYNGLCFHVSQAFFPRTAAWDNLKKALKGEYDETVWDHLAGTTSAPFEPGEHAQVAVKVIDDRGNELLVVKSLKEAGKG